MAINKVISKEKVIETIEFFGLAVDLDEWNDNGWIRAVDPLDKIWHPFIVYKSDYEMQSLSEAMPKDVRDLRKDLKDYLIMLGEDKFKLKLNQLITVENLPLPTIT